MALKYPSSQWDPGATAVEGGSASGTADTGSPVKVGGVYNSSAPTLDNGDRGDLQMDSSANAKMTLATQLAGENLTDDVLGTAIKPVVSATYSGTAFSNFGAATNANVKASAGMLKAISCQNENAAIRYLHVYNKASAPTEDSEVPIFAFAIPAGTAAAPGIITMGENFFGTSGYYFSTGISWGVSVDPDVFDANAVTAGEHQINGIYV